MMTYKTHIRLRLLVAACTFLAISAYAQQTQREVLVFKESYSTNPDVTVNINASHIDVEISTWNKNTVEVEAVVRTESTDRRGGSWKPQVEADKREVSINVNPGFESFTISEIPPVPPIPPIPPIPDMPDVPMPPPPAPPSSFRSTTEFNFDFDAWKEDGDVYLETFREQIEAFVNEDVKKEMARFKEEMEVWKSEIMESREQGREARKEVMDARKEEIEARKQALQARRQALESRKEALEARKKALQSKKEALDAASDTQVTYSFWCSNSSGEGGARTLRIKVPKKAKINLNARHGEVKLSGDANNIQANLTHAGLRAETIDGNRSVVNASYSPVQVTRWDDGELNLSFSPDTVLETVGRMVLVSNSSRVHIGNITGEAEINGSFGRLKISGLSGNFQALRVTLSNSNAEIVLPKEAFDLSLDASGSRLKLPDDLTIEETGTGRTRTITGHRKKFGSGKKVKVNASYSRIKFL